MEWTLNLIAQADPLGVSGLGGWASAGLLGAVLSWLLLKHLPDKDRQIGAMVETFLREIKESRKETSDLVAKERELRHESRNQLHDEHLRMAAILAENTKLLGENTRETTTLAHEVRSLSASVSNIAACLSKA